MYVIKLEDITKHSLEDVNVDEQDRIKLQKNIIIGRKREIK